MRWDDALVTLSQISLLIDSLAALEVGTPSGYPWLEILWVQPFVTTIGLPCTNGRCGTARKKT